MNKLSLAAACVGMFALSSCCDTVRYKKTSKNNIHILAHPDGNPFNETGTSIEANVDTRTRKTTGSITEHKGIFNRAILHVRNTAINNDSIPDQEKHAAVIDYMIRSGATMAVEEHKTVKDGQGHDHDSTWIKYSF